jgi:hypothetical protein
MTLRLPIDLREAVTEEARVAGDLSRVVLFAFRNVERNDVTITHTPRLGCRYPNPSSCTLEEFFKRLRMFTPFAGEAQSDITSR